VPIEKITNDAAWEPLVKDKSTGGGQKSNGDNTQVRLLVRPFEFGNFILLMCASVQRQNKRMRILWAVVRCDGFHAARGEFIDANSSSEFPFQIFIRFLSK
jgi:hypothetical protein